MNISNDEETQLNVLSTKSYSDKFLFLFKIRKNQLSWMLSKTRLDTSPSERIISQRANKLRSYRILSSFSQTRNVDNIGIIVNFVLPYISDFLLC